jgi:hypothetical protein
MFVYNGPFVDPDWRWSEVQVPVRRRGDAAKDAAATAPTAAAAAATTSATATAGAPAPDSTKKAGS